MPTAPKLVSTRWDTPRFEVSPGLTLTPTAQLVTDQTVLNTIDASATSNKVVLVYADPGSNPGIVTAYEPASLQQVRLERNRARIVERERRIRGGLHPTATVSATVTYDSTLTKGAGGLDVTGRPNNTNRVMTPAEKASLPWDMGQPDAIQAVFRGTANGGYAYSMQGNDNTFSDIGAAPGQIVSTSYRFGSAALKIQMGVYRLSGATGDAHHVLCDGLYVGSFRPQDGAGVIDYITMQANDVGGARYHEWEVRTAALVFGIYTAPNYDIRKPASVFTSKTDAMVRVGDSYSDSSVYNDAGSSPGRRIESLSNGVEDLLGIPINYIDAIGGTGFIRRTSGTRGPNNNYEDRLIGANGLLPRMKASGASLTYFCVPNGAINDVAQIIASVSGFTVATVADAATRIFQYVRDNWPNAKIAMGDGHLPPLFSAFPTTINALRTAIQARCNTIGLYYYATQPSLYGTGYLPSNVGTDGPSSLYVGADQAHLNGLGYLRLKYMLAEAEKRVLLDDPLSATSLINTLIPV